MESWEQHFTHHPSKGGVPTRERFLAHHAECLAEAFTVHRSPSPNALLLMGAPGSGKSKLLGKSYLSHPDLVVINPDAYKERLPEYASGKGADLVHEESSWLASQVRIVAIGRSCDLLNDAVGSDKGKYADLIRRLRESGYQTQLLCVHVLDVNVLLNRVAQRALRTGRIVGEAFIREAHSLVPKAFESLRHAVNLSRMVDGTDGTVVYEEVEGKATVRKADFLGRLGEAGRKLST